MSIDESQEPYAPEAEAEQTSSVSRRTLMKTAAGVGVAAAAVGFVGVASTSPSEPDVTAPDASAVNGPIVVHLSDLKAGTVEIFTGSDSTQITDHDLAARIARAAQH